MRAVQINPRRQPAEEGDVLGVRLQIVGEAGVQLVAREGLVGLGFGGGVREGGIVESGEIVRRVGSWRDEVWVSCDEDLSPMRTSSVAQLLSTDCPKPILRICFRGDVDVGGELHVTDSNAGHM